MTTTRLRIALMLPAIGINVLTIHNPIPTRIRANTAYSKGIKFLLFPSGWEDLAVLPSPLSTVSTDTDTADKGARSPTYRRSRTDANGPIYRSSRCYIPVRLRTG